VIVVGAFLHLRNRQQGRVTSRMIIPLRAGGGISREPTGSRASWMQYSRNDVAFERGTVRVRGDVDTWRFVPGARKMRCASEISSAEDIERLRPFEAVDGPSR